MLGVQELRRQWEQAFGWHKNAERPGAGFDWYAADSKGEIACLVTAGCALVPALVFQDMEMIWKVYNYFYKELEDYAVFSKTYNHMDYTLSLYSSKGLSCYDNPSDVNKPYKLKKSPETPAHVSALPADIRDWLEPLTFKRLTFSSANEIDVSRHFKSV